MFNQTIYFKIRNLGFGNLMCLDAQDNQQYPLTVFNCHGKGSNQYWEYVDGFILKDLHAIAYDSRKVVLRYQRQRNPYQVRHTEHHQDRYLNNIF